MTDLRPDQGSRTPAAFASLLPRLFRGGLAFIGVETILSNLTDLQAVKRPDSLPHSVAELVAHVNWWNLWMLDVIEAEYVVPYPKRASLTWPTVRASQWPGVKKEFYDVLARIDTHTMRPDLVSPINHSETTYELLVDFALHT